MTKIYTPEEKQKLESDKQEATDKRNREFHQRKRDAEERAAIKADLIAMGLWIGDAA